MTVPPDGFHRLQVEMPIIPAGRCRERGGVPAPGCTGRGGVVSGRM